MKQYNFKFTSTNNNSKNFNKKSNEPTNYSKILDDIILNNVIKSNEYLTQTVAEKAVDEVLNKKQTSNMVDTYIEYLLKIMDLGNNSPYKFGKKYTTVNGTSIVFYRDEIQIGTDVYTYEEFEEFLHTKPIEQPKKKIIIDIFAPGKNISINIKK